MYFSASCSKVLQYYVLHLNFLVSIASQYQPGKILLEHRANTNTRNSQDHKMPDCDGTAHVEDLEVGDDNQDWDGYQCGFCGAEFKTNSELQCHIFSKHSH